MITACPDCPDGNEWGRDGPTGRACKTCNGEARIGTLEDPMDYYDEYNEWLMRTMPERIRNGDDLIRAFEAGLRFEEFLKQRDNQERKS